MGETPDRRTSQATQQQPGRHHRAFSHSSDVPRTWPRRPGSLGVVAFFPQGINEKNIDWLFPTISYGTSIFDGFCIPSLTYRSNGFVTILATLRDYLCPKDPKSSPLLCATKKRYLNRLAIGIYPGGPKYDEVTSKLVNVEYLLDIFTTIDGRL